MYVQHRQQKSDKDIKMTTSNEKKSVRTLVPLELLEPLLKFPSGLSVPQAKTNAKQLKKAQGISQSEALKLICWGNGVIDIKDYSQAIEQLIVTTFGRSLLQLRSVYNLYILYID